MTTIHVLSICAVLFLTTACNKSNKTDEYRRIVFNADNSRVISSSVNKSLETMSLLYANDSAYRYATGSNDKPNHPTQIYTFVTWQYHDNPYFYGSKINGELLSVESIRIYRDGRIDYTIEQGVAMPVNGNLLNTEERVNYILGHELSSLP